MASAIASAAKIPYQSRESSQTSTVPALVRGKWLRIVRICAHAMTAI